MRELPVIPNTPVLIRFDGNSSLASARMPHTKARGEMASGDLGVAYRNQRKPLKETY